MKAATIVWFCLFYNDSMFRAMRLFLGLYLVIPDSHESFRFHVYLLIMKSITSVVWFSLYE